MRLKIGLVAQLVIMAAVLACGAVWAFDIAGVKTVVCELWPSFGAGAASGTVLAMAAIVAPFPVDPELTAIAVAYRNEEYLADLVFPRVPVGAQNFKYRVYSKADSFTIPNTAVGRTSKPNEVSFGNTETDSSTIDHALDEPVPMADIENAPVNYNPLTRATASVMDLVQLDREKRCADLLFGAGNYGSSNKSTLSGSSQFSHADSEPFDQLEDAMDVCVMRPNIVVFGLIAWRAFKRHANVIARVLGSANSKGQVTRLAAAEALEVDQVLVGKGWYNSAAKGQTTVMTRLWGDYCSLIHQDKMADVRGRITFGYTAQWGNPTASRNPDSDIGMRGGIRVRAGESVKELVTANDLGYLFSDCVA